MRRPIPVKPGTCGERLSYKYNVTTTGLACATERPKDDGDKEEGLMLKGKDRKQEKNHKGRAISATSVEKNKIIKPFSK